MLTPPQKGRMEVGVDEVGRGCLFGPVVAGAVVLPDPEALTDPRWAQIKDSKKLSEKKRTALAEFIRSNCIAYGYGVVSHQDIDRVNILKATFMAMNQALDHVYRHSPMPFEFIYIDGPHFPGYLPPGENDECECIEHACVPNGDAEILSIAAASILAKTHRDQMVTDMIHAYPDHQLQRYGIHKNKGYGTKEHMDALQEYGPTPWHRQTFRGVLPR